VAFELVCGLVAKELYAVNALDQRPPFAREALQLNGASGRQFREARCVLRRDLDPQRGPRPSLAPGCGSRRARWCPARP
jgi:hypothetical protein